MCQGQFSRPFFASAEGLIVPDTILRVSDVPVFFGRSLACETNNPRRAILCAQFPWNMLRRSVIVVSGGHMRVLFALFALGCLASSGASGQTYYKCPQKSGGVAYTDVPCPGKAGKILTISPAEAAAFKVDKEAAAIDRMLNDQNISVNEVQARAHAHGLDSLFQQRVQVHNARALVFQANLRASRAAYQRSVEASRLFQQTALVANNARLAAQNDQLTSQNQQLQSDRDTDAQAAQNAAANAQIQNMTPKFDPASRQWCTSNGGVLQCH